LGYLESTLRAIVMITPGRQSEIASEAAYTALSLLQFYHDNVITRYLTQQTLYQRTIQKKLPPQSVINIARVLSTISYVELFTEMASRAVWGNKRKWICVFIIELAKALLRFVMLYKLKGRILSQQTFPHREHLLQTIKNTNTSSVLNISKPSQPTIWRILGEILYIIRPLVYLTALFYWRKHSWGTWSVSLAVDICGRLCTGNISTANEAEKDEITRRTVLWLYYILRSPFFEAASRNSIIKALYNAFHAIPFLNLIIDSIFGHIIAYRCYYFYTAGSS